jgi:uncharacterized Zn finger protein
MQLKSHISDQHVLDFFEAKHVRPTCPCCGNTQWHRLMEPLHGFNYAVAPLPREFTGAYSGLEVVVVYCMNCGFVRQHAAHLFRAWEEEKHGT